MTTIDARNQPVNAGHYYSDGQLLRNEVGGKLRSAEDVKDLIMQTPSGGQVKLGDIAEVAKEYADPQTRLLGERPSGNRSLRFDGAGRCGYGCR